MFTVFARTNLTNEKVLHYCNTSLFMDYLPFHLISLLFFVSYFIACWHYFLSFRFFSFRFLSFLFLSFLFLSFPFLSFPFFSFSLSFLSSLFIHVFLLVFPSYLIHSRLFYISHPLHASVSLFMCHFFILFLSLSLCFSPCPSFAVALPVSSFPAVNHCLDLFSLISHISVSPTGVSSPFLSPHALIRVKVKTK